MDEPKLPVSPPSTAKLRAQDLALLEEDARRFVVRDRPASDALWLALLKPRDVVLREYRAATIAWAEGAAEPNAGFLDHAGRPLGQGPAAIHCIANAVVAKALLGDMAAAANVMERIEGRPAQRKLDEGEAAESRATMIAGIEAVVRAMNERPGDKALDVTPGKANGSAFPERKGKPNGHEPEIP